MAVENWRRAADDPFIWWMERVFYKRLKLMELESAEFFFLNFFASSGM